MLKIERVYDRTPNCQAAHHIGLWYCSRFNDVVSFRACICAFDALGPLEHCAEVPHGVQGN